MKPRVLRRHRDTIPWVGREGPGGVRTGRRVDRRTRDKRRTPGGGNLVGWGKGHGGEGTRVGTKTSRGRISGRTKEKVLPLRGYPSSRLRRWVSPVRRGSRDTVYSRHGYERRVGGLGVRSCFYRPPEVEVGSGRETIVSHSSRRTYPSSTPGSVGVPGRFSQIVSGYGVVRPRSVDRPRHRRRNPGV